MDEFIASSSCVVHVISTVLPICSAENVPHSKSPFLVSEIVTFLEKKIVTLREFVFSPLESTSTEIVLFFPLEVSLRLILAANMNAGDNRSNNIAKKKDDFFIFKGSKFIII